MFKYAIIILILFLAGGIYVYAYDVYVPVNKNGSDRVFSVSKGEGVKEISRDLQNAGLIRSSFFFETYVWLTKSQSKFVAGDFTLSSKLNTAEIVKVFVSGETLSKERTIKIVEGWNAKEIASYLENNDVVSASDFLNAVDSKNADLYKKDYDFLSDKPKDASLEGYLFPDTYRIYKDASVNDVIKKMLDNFDRKLTPEMRADIAKRGRTIYEEVTMASLIEKEVKTESDMKIVSGIFWKRIKNGQPLELDSTLTYALGDSKTSHSIEETRINSPYNTYKYKGLPPGPIANPSLNAIDAAIYPEETDYNYFLTDASGRTIFSKTYAEHLQNKAKYLGN